MAESPAYGKAAECVRAGRFAPLPVLEKLADQGDVEAACRAQIASFRRDDEGVLRHAMALFEARHDGSINAFDEMGGLAVVRSFARSRRPGESIAATEKLKGVRRTLREGALDGTESRPPEPGAQKHHDDWVEGEVASDSSNARATFPSSVPDRLQLAPRSRADALWPSPPCRGATRTLYVACWLSHAVGRKRREDARSAHRDVVAALLLRRRAGGAVTDRWLSPSSPKSAQKILGCQRHQVADAPGPAASRLDFSIACCRSSGPRVLARSAPILPGLRAADGSGRSRLASPSLPEPSSELVEVNTRHLPEE